MKKQMDFNGEWSNEYDDTAHKIILGYHTIYALIQHLLRNRLNQKARILVAGAGTGKEMIDCSHNNPHWSFTGFDPAESMLSIAQKKSDEYNTFNAAWKNQQMLTRGDNDRVEKEFIIRENEVHFIPQQRIETLLKEAGFLIFLGSLPINGNTF